MTARMRWREDAACRDAGPDLFFPIGTTGVALGQIEEAKQICRICPAQVQCLAWVLEKGGRRRRMGRHHPGRAARHPEPSGNKDNRQGR